MYGYVRVWYAYMIRRKPETAISGFQVELRYRTGSPNDSAILIRLPVKFKPGAEKCISSVYFAAGVTRNF